ncbi:kinase-like domain-containing protein [Rostrohypoxylon terebratum]|nr:kinase-like domain-containing protein [Rostrohypoxylon terebratum]
MDGFPFLYFDECDLKHDRYKTKDISHLQKYQGTCTYNLLLPDSRRQIFVTAPASVCAEEGLTTAAAQNVARVWQHLSHEVVVIRIDAEGRLEEATPNPADADRLRRNSFIRTIADIPRPLLSDTPFSNWPTLQHSQLIELDRLTRNVDVVKVAGESEAPLVVKWMLTDDGLMHYWNEMNIQKALKPHPSILPLDRIVLDKAGGHIIGIATKFIKGGTLSSLGSRTFKLKWLKQLTKVLDFIHLDQGIVHGDLKFDNILIDGEAGRLLIFDFDRARDISDENIEMEMHQMVWNLYGLLTQDDDIMWGCSHDFDPKILEETAIWPVKTKLDCHWKKLRDHLMDWVERRKGDGITAKNQIAVTWQGDTQADPTRTQTQHLPLDPDMVSGRTRINIDWKRPSYEEAYPAGPQFGGYGSEGVDSRKVKRFIKRAKRKRKDQAHQAHQRTKKARTNTNKPKAKAVDS